MLNRFEEFAKNKILHHLARSCKIPAKIFTRDAFTDSVVLESTNGVEVEEPNTKTLFSSFQLSVLLCFQGTVVFPAYLVGMGQHHLRFISGFSKQAL